MPSREINQKKNQKCREINNVYFKIADSSKIALKSIKRKPKVPTNQSSVLQIIKQT